MYQQIYKDNFSYIAFFASKMKNPFAIHADEVLPPQAYCNTLPMFEELLQLGVNFNEYVTIDHEKLKSTNKHNLLHCAMLLDQKDGIISNYEEKLYFTMFTMIYNGNSGSRDRSLVLWWNSSRVLHFLYQIFQF